MKVNKGHHAPTRKRKENTFLIARKTKDDLVFTPLKLLINHTLHVIKVSTLCKTPNQSKHDPDLLEARGHYSFHGSRGHATLNCQSLKKAPQWSSSIWITQRVCPRPGGRSGGQRNPSRVYQLKACWLVQLGTGRSLGNNGTLFTWNDTVCKII